MEAMEVIKEGTYTMERPLREQVLEFLREEKMTKSELAIQIDYSRSAVSRYLSDKYEADASVLESKLKDFMQSNGRTPAGAPDVGPSLVVPLREKTQNFESGDYVQVIGVCRACQEHHGLGIVVAKSGYGKTHALRSYAKMPRVVYIEGNETMNCKDIIRRIENRIGMSRSYGSIDERMEKIVDFFNINEGYLIIMDEADKLINKYTQKKIELLRNITDSADVGLVIAGEPLLETLMKGYDARFTNRMDFYYKLRGLTKSEVEDYLEGYDIEEAAMAEFITRATNTQTGCFRLLDRTLNNVLRILRESGRNKINMNVMRQASAMMLL
jgi:hypothetical protein